MPPRPLRLAAARGVKEKRLLALLRGRDPRAPELRRALATALARGSLELAGLERDVAAAERLEQALELMSQGAPFGAKALLEWHAALTGDSHGFRREPVKRPDGVAAAPPELVAERVDQLASWLGADSGRELSPAQAGALVLARLTEIRPFDSANGRASRLAAAHVMEAAGGRPPLLSGPDAGRLETALAAALRLDTAPLSELLDEAAERSLDHVLDWARGLDSGS